MNKQDFRNVCGQFATGVAVVTTANRGQHYGLTVNSFTSVSLDPPLVLFCVDRMARFNEQIQQSGVLAINFLKKQQKDISNRFANPKLSAEERFLGVALSKEHPAPLLADTLAYMECSVEAIHEGGDHYIYVVKVSSGAVNSGDPLLYFGGNYRSVMPES